MNGHNAQKGSILVYILIAVALFAALGYAVANMMRSGGNIGDEKAGIIAVEAISYAHDLREAIKMLRMFNDCQDTQISFERAPFDGTDAAYVNPNSPADFSCHIFHSNGGKILASAPDDEVNGGVDWIITGHNSIPNVGDNTNPDLIFIIPETNHSICLKMNKIVGVENPDGDAPEDTDGVSQITFQGAYILSEQIGEEADLNSKISGCYKHTQPSPDTYNFYQVLLPR